MSADDIQDFLVSPFSVMADVKMLDFFRQAGSWTIGVLSVLVLLSVVTKNFWCRYLCPYGALMGLVSLASPVRITRGYTRHAEGSVLVEFGNTRVLCTATVEERPPAWLKGQGVRVDPVAPDSLES